MFVSACVSVTIFKSVNINVMLYLFCTRQYYIISPHLTLATTSALFHFNLIYMCLYLHVFLFKNFNINFMLYLFYTGPYYTICLHITLTMTH